MKGGHFVDPGDRLEVAPSTETRRGTVVCLPWWSPVRSPVMVVILVVICGFSGIYSGENLSSDDLCSDSSGCGYSGDK